MTLSWSTVSILAQRIQFTDDDAAPAYFITVAEGSNGEIYSESSIR